MKILVFGGTSEGRNLVEWLASRGSCEVVSYAATEYGGSLVANDDGVDSRVDRLSEVQMEELLKEERFDCVVDATHPYAALVTENIRRAAMDADVPHVRLVREEEPEGDWLGSSNAEEAARMLKSLPGNILLTTGSKDLKTFVEALDDYEERLYARVLPVPASIQMTQDLGIPPAHVIAMQGPFTKAMNVALIEQFGISILVTKAAGSAGGFWEKIDAARECGINALVIHRPLNETGLSLEETKRLLAQAYAV